MFRKTLENMLSHQHELYRLAGLINRGIPEQEFGKRYSEEGRPGISIRLMAGLSYPGQAFGISDDEVVRRWVENPYRQYFCGEQYFRHELPIDPSSMTRRRKRIREAGARLVLKVTLTAGVKCKAVRSPGFERIPVDTTVQPEAVAFSTDSRLYNRSRERLVKLAEEYSVALRQSCSRPGRALPTQERKEKNRLYSLHAPEVECIARGRAHKKYEFGVQVSVAATNRGNFVVGVLAEHGNPYDGHTLAKAIDQVKQVTGKVRRTLFC